jgi:hypothetical protein
LQEVWLLLLIPEFYQKRLGFGSFGGEEQLGGVVERCSACLIACVMFAELMKHYR